MARPKASLPTLRPHISGQALCRIDGVDFYLGRHGSPESLARYAVLMREYQAGGLNLPPDFCSETLRQMTVGFSYPAAKVHGIDEPITISVVTAGYVQHAETYYESDPQMLGKIKLICNELDKHHGKVLADDFGPVLLGQQRERWIKRDLSRPYVNSMTNLVFRMFKWAVSQEMVEATTLVRIKTLEPLRRGKTKARETVDRKPVPLEHVRATAKHLSPILKALLRIHVCTGARPTELLTMRPCDIDRTGAEWIYRPAKHKNTNRGKTRAIPIVGDAKEALIDYLNRDPHSYCFSPKQTIEWQNAEKRAKRKTKVQPSQMHRAKGGLSTVGDRYTKDSYRRAIQRAAAAAGVPSWHPYQLRHLAGTVVRAALGIEGVEALLGHAGTQMAGHYAKIQEERAVQAAKHAPTLGGDK